MSMYRGTPEHKRHFRPAVNPEVAKALAQRRHERHRAQIRADIEAARAKATVPLSPIAHRPSPIS